MDLGLALDVGPDPIILLLLAPIADALFGGGALRVDRALFSPRAVLARMIGGLERRLNREWRGAITRLIRGLLLVVVVAALSYGAGWALLALAAAVPFTWIIVLALIFALVSQRGAFDAVRGYLPAFMTGLFLSLAALVVPGASPLRGLVALAGRRVAGPLNRWWPTAVMHAAFGSDPASSGNPEPPANLLDRVLYLYAVAVGVSFLAVLLVAMRRVAM